MSSHNQQDQVSLNWLHTCQQKEVTTSFDNVFMDFNSRSSYYSTQAASAVSLFQPIMYEDSPTMTTPFLDSGCLSPSSSNHPLCYNIPQTINTPVQHYLGVEENDNGRCGPTFTGDPMELLINKSNGVSASPTYSLSSDGVATPLFGPISSAHNDDDSSNQQYELHQQEIDDFLQEYRPFEMKSDLRDWPCFHGGDISLFQELEGIINNTLITTTATTTTPVLSNVNQQNNDPPKWSPAITHQPLPDQHHPTTNRSTGAYSSTTTTKKRATTNKSTITKNNKRKRNNSEGKNATQNNNTATTNDDQQDDDDDDDNDDKKNNKKRSATKKQKPDQTEKKYGCPICRRKFSRRYNLNTHIRTHNANRIKEFLCDVCDFGFDRKHDRDRHLISVHRAERDFSCDHCDASFCRRDALARHTLKSHPDS